MGDPQDNSRQRIADAAASCRDPKLKQALNLTRNSATTGGWDIFQNTM
jgi:hypothetical protein